MNANFFLNFYTFTCLLLLWQFSLSQNCTDNELCSQSELITLTPNVTTCVTDCNIGAAIGPDFIGNYCFDMNRPSVWYRFTIPNQVTSINVSISSGQLNTPYFAIFSSTNCTNFSVVYCKKGSLGSVNANQIMVQPNASYYLVVADDNNNQGNFDLCITPILNPNVCNINSSLVVTQTSKGSPLSGPFLPDEIVTFCYTITQFNQTGCNYLQGIVPTFGDCWDTNFLNPLGQPVVITPIQTAGIISSCGGGCPCANQSAGTWNWFGSGVVNYNNILGSYPPGTPLPAGWYFLSTINPSTTLCSPSPNDPNNSIGDSNYPFCSVNNLTWQVCFQLKVKSSNACNVGNTNCFVSIKTFTDGEIGAYNSNACANDLSTYFPSVICCVPKPSITSPSPACSPFSFSLTPTPIPGVTFLWYTSPNSTSPIFSGNTFNTPLLTQTTTYYVEAVSNLCTSEREAITLVVNPIPSAPTISNVSVCSGNSVQLTPSAPSGATFVWYTQSTGGVPIFSGTTFTTPIITSNTTYFVESVLNGCTSSTRRQVNITVIATPNPPNVNNPTICSGRTATLTASGGGSGATYIWYSQPTGGTAIHTGNSYVTPILNATTQYFVEVVVNGCTSSRATSTVTVNPTPPAPTVNNVFICPNTTATLTASGSGSGATYRWFTVATGGTPVFTGNPFITPSLTTSRTYYVEAILGGCTSSRTQVTVTVGPDQPIVSNQIICAGNSATLTATAPTTATFHWYTVPTGGTPFFIGNPLVTPPLSSNQTYYVEAVENGCTSVRRTVTVTVNPTPPAPTVTVPTVCIGNMGTLIVTNPTGGTIQWYSTINGTTPIFTGYTFNTPILTAPVTYYLEAVVGGCTSSRISVLVNVVPGPEMPTAVSNTVCIGQSGTLTASTNPNNAQFLWYDVPSAGTPLFIGNPFITPPLTGNTTYYVEAVANNCTSTRIPVTALTNNPIPSVSNTTICANSSVSLNANAPAGTTIRWFNVPIGGTPIFVGNPFNTPILTSTTTYYVEGILNGCTSSRATVTVNVNPQPPFANVNDTSVCFGTSVTFTPNQPIGATFRWFNVSTGGVPIGINQFTTPLLTANTTYYVETILNGCTSSRKPVMVTVRPLPAQPTVNDVNICKNTSANFIATAPNGATFLWYDAPTGGTLLHTGTNYTSPPLSSNTSFYVESVQNGCTSSRKQVNATIIPTDPVVNVPNVCAGLPAVLFANSNPGSAIRWYNVSTGGNPIYQGNPLVTGLLNQDTTFYVEAILSGCTSSRVAVQVVVTPIPNAIQIPEDTVCFGSNAIINGNPAPNQTLVWYRNSSGGTPLFTGNPFITGAITSDTVYYVEVVSNGCTSSRNPVSVKTKPLPPEPFVQPITICPGNHTTIQPIISMGETFYWYSDSNQVNPIAISDTFQTPVYVLDDSVYVAAFLNGCFSKRVKVKINVFPSPPIFNQNFVICEGDSITLTPNLIPGLTYQWYDVPVRGSPFLIADSFTTPPLFTSTTYYLEAVLDTCFSVRTPIPITVTPLPSALPSHDTTICAGNSLDILLDSLPNTTYLWYTQPQNGSPFHVGFSYRTPVLQDTVYYYIETVSNLCTSSTRSLYSINVNPIPTLSSIQDTVICRGDFANLWANSNNGSTLVWYDSTNLQQPIFVGSIFTTNVLYESQTYYVESIYQGCTSLKQKVKVTVNPVFAGNDTVICPSSVILLEGYPLGGVWSGLGVMGDWFDANITGLGNHLVIYQLENCYDTKLITVKDTLTPQVSVQPNLPARVLISQAKFFLNDNTQGAVSWNWDFGNGQTSNLQNSVVQYENSGKYIITLIITDSLGCTSYWVSDTITVEYEELETSNVFTPNGDGINDWFLPKIEGYDLEVFRIYDRWGVPVFLSNAISQGWNGKNANGTDVPEGVYTYVLELVKPNGTKFIRTGVVTLLR